MRAVVIAAAAEEFLVEKQALAHDQFGNSASARLDDMLRFGTALRNVLGNDNATEYTLEAVYDGVTTTQLTYERVMAAFAMLRAGYAPATVTRTRSTLAGFTYWLRRRGIIESDPMEDVQFARTAPGFGNNVVMHAFTANEVAALMAAADRPPPSSRSAWPMRDAAMVSTAAHCGLRATELASLQVRHIDRRFERPILRLVLGTKGAKPRDVPIPAATLAAVDAYLAERSDRYGSYTPSDQCFVRLDGRAIDRSFIDRLVRRLAASTGIAVPHQSASHALRHHFGVQLAMRGVPVPVIQALLGHSDSRTTAVYTRLVATQLTDALTDAGWL